MAFTSRVMQAGTAEIFAVLTSPETYPRWLIGTTTIRHIDADWPNPGSGFHHVVGFGPLQIPDRTEVLEIEPGVLLRLKVQARPLVMAEATFTVVGDEERSVVTFQEEPLLGWIGELVRPILDPTTHVRNHRSLRRLADIVEGGQNRDREDRTEGADG